MEFIGTKRLKEEIEKRISAPENYAKRSLVLWGSHSRSIVERIVKECCLEYYKTNKPADGCWFMQANTTFDTAKINDIRVIETRDYFLSEGHYAEHRKGIFIADTFYVDYENDIPAFISLVNTHKNNVGELAAGWAFVACVESGKSSSLTPDVFNQNCEQYFFVPDFDEWADYVVKRKGKAAQIVVDYIKGNGNPASVLGKWFKPVTVNQGNKSSTTYFDAYKWENIIDNLRDELEDAKELNKVRVGVIRMHIRGITGGWNTTIGEDFCDFLKSLQSE